MRFTIERIRTLVLVVGALLVTAIVGFLAVGRWKNPFNRPDIPKRLGIDIEQEANGVTYTQAHAGHTLFKIHASKVVQLKNDHAMLHDVTIELYGADGTRTDRIVGDEFEYDQKDGTATAAGPVEITLERPGEKPAIEQLPAEIEARKTRQNVSGTKTPVPAPPATTAPGASAPPALAAASNVKGQIDVKTSGLVFNQQTGVATTTQKVNFSSLQGTGSSIGASYDSENGFLVLDHAVELTTRPSATGGHASRPVQVHADQAEFERDSSLCRLHAATAKTGTEQLTATDTKILFRDDGSIARLYATGGFTIATVTGAHLAAPAGLMNFDEKNHLQHGQFDGGVTMDSVSDGRVSHGTSSTMELEFSADGDLSHAHMEGDVAVRSEDNTQSTSNGKPLTSEANRTWHSVVADVQFRKGEKGRIEPATIHGAGGVTITSETRRGNEVPLPAKLVANEVAGEFGPASALTHMTGTGHASLEETAANGAHETATGDRVEAHFIDTSSVPASQPTMTTKAAGNSLPSGAQQIQSAVLEGHVVLVDQPAPQAGAQPQEPLRATAGRADYDGAGQWLHLTVNPRVEDAGLQLTADKVDVAQASGDAFAHGNVKATWVNNGTTASAEQPLGGRGPSHAVAAEAEIHQATGEATFRGHARLWQETNSVAAPIIVLNREKQTLTATSANPAEPVRVVIVSAHGPTSNATSSAAKTATPSIIRVSGGDLWYSDVERRARMESGALGPVKVDTGSVESTSNEAELFLAPTGGNNGALPSGTQSQVDHMTASGHVVLTSQDRRGTGEQLAYAGRTGDYVLTGTGAAPPRMSDAVRGTVTGEALIYHTRDDSVSVEGGGQKTRTDTTAPK